MPDRKQLDFYRSEPENIRNFFALALASCAVFVLVWMIGPAPVRAQEKPVLLLELNSLDKLSKGCRMNFVMRNGLTAAIEELGFEIVLFDKEGRIGSLLRLNGGRLPTGKTSVRQFDLQNTSCDNISRILVNEITVCKGEGLTPRSCLAALDAKSRAKVAFGL